ncbi:MAG: peptide-methionine (S)-S-oxide reductase MsrA [Gammaproteobacteria bacterium]|nr:MAG: peptide-methionine (S)-S-oxide reductase MsrA [Gammaproteobacteria bacterium]
MSDPHRRTSLPGPGEAVPGRPEAMLVPERHFVTGNRMVPPFPGELRQAVFGMGCFWGAERLFWQQAGVHATAVGYAGGSTPNPSYREVCSGLTGHAEVVLVVFDPAVLDYSGLLRLFWESHDPTQGMRQGADVGTQYRSVIYWFDESQQQLADESRAVYARALAVAGHRQPITTELARASVFYYAEEYHQQYLAKNPDGYCGIGGTGVSCPGGFTSA